MLSSKGGMTKHFTWTNLDKLLRLKGFKHNSGRVFFMAVTSWIAEIARKTRAKTIGLEKLTNPAVFHGPADWETFDPLGYE
jgi:hypothetical protein